MPVHGLPLILLCLSPMWRILIAVSCPRQHTPCQLAERTAVCNNCKLSNVPESHRSDIETLQLDYNDIETLQDTSLQSYPSLKSLSIAFNRLVRIESNTFESSKLLERLNLTNNNLNIGYQETGLALRKLPGIRILDLSENKLDNEMASLLLQNLTSLEHLCLSGNILRRLDENSFRDLHQLKDLDLQRNIIFEIDGAFDSNAQLQRLNLAFNYLPCLTDFHMTQLVFLNVSHNAIEWFISRQELDSTFHLETLDLSNNKLLFFPFLPSKGNLRNLYLSHNIVSFYKHLADNVSYPNSTSTVEFFNVNQYSSNVTAQLWNDDLFGDVSALKVLDLRGNQVTYFPEGFIKNMPFLSSLHMSSNCLETLNLTSEQFSGTLSELDISNNRLSQIFADESTLASLGNLTYFNLSLNGLTELPFGLFSSLQSIRSVDISYNNVNICLSNDVEMSTDAIPACVDWRNIVSLRQLYLKGCHLKAIPSTAFTALSLTHLELSDNPGLVVQNSLQSLSRTLQHLGLGNTQIQDLDFSDFQSLKYLNLSRNSLAHLPPSLQNTDLKVLDLRDNKLSTMPSGQASALASKLQTVFLTGNPFNCCQTEWFRTFETIETLNIVELSKIKCEDLFQVTHSIENSQSFLCLETRDTILFYILLFVPVFVSLLGISVIILLTFKPKMLQKSIKKKYLKPTSY
ncbi:transforming growth factor beta activator LRRC33 [Menidia menidia]